MVQITQIFNTNGCSAVKEFHLLWVVAGYLAKCLVLCVKVSGAAILACMIICLQGRSTPKAREHSKLSQKEQQLGNLLSLCKSVAGGRIKT